MGVLVTLFVFSCFSFVLVLETLVGFHVALFVFSCFSSVMVLGILLGSLLGGLIFLVLLCFCIWDFFCPFKSIKTASPESKAGNRKEMRQGENRGKKDQYD